MKKILSSLALATILGAPVFLTGCANKIDEIRPVNYVDAAGALQTSADVEAALIGAYDGLSSAGLYGGQLQFMSDLLGDNGEESFVGTFTQPREAFQKTLLITNTFVRDAWLDGYRTINIANTVLANVSKVDASRRDKVEGEAKFIRAAVYFELVRLFGKDWNDGTPATNLAVPLILVPTDVVGSSSLVARNTVAEVYAQVIQDLTDAEAKTPASNGVYANKVAAQGMLSRVYLQQNRYTDAAAAANRAISANLYALVPNFAGEFDNPANTTEDIFAIQISAQDGTNSLNTYYANNRRADVEIQVKHRNLYEAADDRGKYFTGIYTKKYGYTGVAGAQYRNVKVMRLAELYLTRAEANFRAGTSVGAAPLADVNRVRARALLAPLTTLTLDAILKERHLELAFEGFQLNDLKRNKLPVGALPYNSPKLVFPIPQRELDVNPNLVQNEGYL
ncbi:RagB/SusD family nutrient uptake outer membrane protein [Hymenobacter sp. GOD-10R]|uniref:RagB/SusD family nutrient uptake outer membrane protein n=1 Tax=Hymenobacter sp. GOD-10R TaxID=3093922 RepID=UPI002D79B3CA|nr:RagB/SusD family nutrient uptake outer membrane protein [Hymenobacter sp. GOD-10R]WRQ29807.1 RagB/SusD family nutrient uptake outer membrane protein [Hymenobacter sp. GOD-10R]